MQNTTPLTIPSSAAIQMQTHLSNLIAIQNLQEYLKYLILTTSVEPQKMKTPEKPAEMKDQITTKKEEGSITMEEEIADKSTLTPVSDKSFNSFSSMSKRRKSQKLFSLMQKKYVQPAEPKISSDDAQSEKRAESISERNNVLPLLKKNSKPKHMICGHTNREHYAKGLCGSCYLKFGRTKKPWNCSHDKLYALGLCQKCYAVKYNMKKKTVDPVASSFIKSEILSQLNDQKIQVPNFNQDLPQVNADKMIPEQVNTIVKDQVVVKIETN